MATPTKSNGTAPNPASIPVGLILGLPKPASGDISYGWQIEVAATVTFIFAFFAVALRTTARWRYAKLGWDDYLMAFAVVRLYPSIGFPELTLSLASSASRNSC